MSDRLISLEDGIGFVFAALAGGRSEKRRPRTNRCRESRREDENVPNVSELGSVPRQVEVTPASADVERLTFTRDGFLRPLSANYSAGAAAPITGRLIV